jgi:SAM-dependent methyltransferase
MGPPITFPSNAFLRENEEDDEVFYTMPRRVVHIDDAARAALTRLYGALVPPRGSVLDLMASWRSHLPATFAGSAVGLGLNRDEMGDNPQLSQAIVQNVNRDPRLPFNDAAFDAVLCAVSVQYLTHPVEVFREVWRTLKPQAPFVVSFSNRCFPEKAVALWRAASDRQHVAVVVAYFEASGGLGQSWHDLIETAHEPSAGDPLWVVWALKAG